MYPAEERHRRPHQLRTTAPNSTILSHWLPLGATIAAVIVGFATWAWNERRNGEGGDGSDSDSESRKSSATGISSAQGITTIDHEQDENKTKQPRTGSVGLPISKNTFADYQDSQSIQMGVSSGNTSNLQLIDATTQRAALSGDTALSADATDSYYMRDTEESFQDHQTWSMEVEKRLPETQNMRISQKRMIAVVVSALDKHSNDNYSRDHDVIDHTSILSHMPLHIDRSAVDLVVLIHAPQSAAESLSITAESSIQELGPVASNASPPSPASARFEESGVRTSHVYPQNKLASLKASALELVPYPTHIIPFSTSTGHVQLLRHIAPSLVYIQEDLCGNRGEYVREIEDWVGQIVVVIGGSGIVDTETEDEVSKPQDRNESWWKDTDRVGLGKADVVESVRFEEDWMKRVGV